MRAGLTVDKVCFHSMWWIDQPTPGRDLEVSHLSVKLAIKINTNKSAMKTFGHFV